MEQWQHNLLRSNFVFLLENLERIPVILDYLFQDYVIGLETYEDIKEQKDDRDRARSLLFNLHNSRRPCFHSFIHALVRTNNIVAADRLLPGLLAAVNEAGDQANQASNLASGQVSSLTSGQASSLASGQASSLTSGQASSLTSGQASSLTSGQASNVASGQAISHRVNDQNLRELIHDMVEHQYPSAALAGLPDIGNDVFEGVQVAQEPAVEFLALLGVGQEEEDELGAPVQADF